MDINSLVNKLIGETFPTPEVAARHEMIFCDRKAIHIIGIK